MGADGRIGARAVQVGVGNYTVVPSGPGILSSLRLSR